MTMFKCDNCGTVDDAIYKIGIRIGNTNIYDLCNPCLVKMSKALPGIEDMAIFIRNSTKPVQTKS